MPALVTTVMYDEVMYLPGHLVHRWTADVERQLVLTITAAAPINKRPVKSNSPKTFGGITPVGHLKASINGTHIGRPGLRRLEFSVISSAAYSAAVIFGTKGGTKAGGLGSQRRTRGGTFTSGVITGKKYYVLPNQGFGETRTLRFGGQRPNDFMTTGYHAVAAAHSAL